jgi:fructose-1-phosphate kinase PfkB-like protein
MSKNELAGQPGIRIDQAGEDGQITHVNNDRSGAIPVVLNGGDPAAVNKDIFVVLVASAETVE